MIGIGFYFLSVIIIVLLIVTGTLFAANYFYQNDLKQLDKRIGEQETILKNYSDLEKNVSSVNAKLKIIDQIDAKRTIWSNIITEMAGSTPVAVQINTFASTADTLKITITGIAETRRDIAKFKDKLESSKNFKNVIFTTSTFDTGSNSFNFNITCELEEIK